MSRFAGYKTLKRIEDWIVVVVLLLMVALPLVEIVARKVVGRGIPGSIPMVEHLTLWIAFLGAALAARSGRLLSLATEELLPNPLRRSAGAFAGLVGAGVALWLARASFELVRVEFTVPNYVAMGIPVWVAMSIMPLALVCMAARLAWKGIESHWVWLLLGLGLFLTLGISLPEMGQEALLTGLLIIGLATLLGMPIFCAIGGLALLLFWYDGIPVASVPVETYRLTQHPMLPAIPLFTLGGYILSEGGASRRLVRLFQALVGWMPGGLAMVTTGVLAFFTPLTGASGVTILSMGGVLLPVLKRARYPERFSIGLVTVSGSIGLLLPLSLPVILYAVTSHISVVDLFVGAMVPGFFLIFLIAAWGFRQGLVSRIERVSFNRSEALAAIWEAKWELLLPVVIIGGIVGGFTTWVEASALTVLYALVVECLVHRDLKLSTDLKRIAVESGTLVGGFLIILGMALGLTNYLITAEVPMLALGWVQSHVESPYVFLLALNIFLLIVGGLMDIYSAIFVIVPLITPIAAAYGINPIHLGVIFLANLELGYLTPPMGENLFLSSYRFNQPLSVVFRAIVPYWLILMGGVLLITYFPPLTLALLELLSES